MSFVQPPGSPKVTPLSFGVPLAWYTFTTGYCFSDTGLTTPCVEGDDIKGIVDRSGNGNTLTQAVGANAPKFQNSGWSAGKPAASFSATPQYLFSATATHPILNRMQGADLPYTVFATIRPALVDTQALIGWHNLVNSKISCINSSNTTFPGTVIGALASVRTDDAASTAFSEGQNALGNLINHRAAWVSTGVRIMGVLDEKVEFDAAQDVGTLTPTIFSLGTDQNTIGKFAGLCAEVIIWDRALSFQEVQQLRGYSIREFG